MSYPPAAGPQQGNPSAVPTPAFASFFVRLASYLVDGLPVAILGYIGSAIDGPKLDPETLQSSGGGAIYYVFQLLAFAFVVWNRWYQGGATGQSIGRKALGIRLVGANTGQPIGFGKAFLRDICHLLDSLACFVGWLFPLWDAKRQTFADKIVGTVVVK